jgi:MoxR-like ATPase
MAGKSRDVLSSLAEVGVFRTRVLAALHGTIVGQDRLLELLLASVLVGGHSLLVGVPGLAKTLAVSCLAAVLKVRSSRIQFTPDLMPADITGSEVIEESGRGGKKFRFVPGPVFANLVLADEINRTPPKTQAALLQAMQERQVTVAGQTYPLPPPFIVMATQNPIEQEGTYPLPEAELDRFLFSIPIPYPDAVEEQAIAKGVASGGLETLPDPVSDGATLLRLGAFIKERFPIADTVIRAAVRLVRSSRPDAEAPQIVRDYVSWGAGPRGGSFLVLAAKAHAALAGKKAADLDDVRAMALPVLRHRILVNYEAEADGVDADRVVEALLENLAPC